MNNSTSPVSFRWWVLLTIAVSSACSGMVIMSFAPLIGDIAKDFNVDLGTASFGLLGITTFVSAVSISLLGIAIDKVGIFSIIILSQLLILVSNAAIPFVGHNYDVLVFIRVIQGLGAAGLTVAITPALALWFPRHEMGRAMGFQSIGIPVGIMLGLNAAPVLSELVGGWRWGIGLLSLVPLLALITTVPVAAMSIRHRPTVSSAERREEAVPASAFLRMPAFWVGLVTLGLCGWVGIPFNSLSPGFLAVSPPVGAGYGPQGAGNLMLFFTLAGVVGPPLGGFLIDKAFGGRSRPLIMVGWILSAVFYTAILLPAVHDQRFVLMAVLLVAGLANPFINVTLMSYAAKSFSAHVVGRVCGLWLSLASLTASAGVLMCSLALSTTGSYTIPILIIGGSSVIGLLLAPFLKQPSPQTSSAIYAPLILDTNLEKQ